jgi:hypothetical protein
MMKWVEKLRLGEDSRQVLSIDEYSTCSKMLARMDMQDSEI